jgi:16S rRNA A1518/A1519 N6-dimethyltransferase RsmA/KsgA/DIM1 with predicted DNA glycosylase/AP lyase activity
MRRKTLRNAWAALGDEVDACAAACGIDLGRRGETLSVEDFARFARSIAEARATRRGLSP